MPDCIPCTDGESLGGERRARGIHIQEKETVTYSGHGSPNGSVLPRHPVTHAINLYIQPGSHVASSQRTLLNCTEVIFVDNLVTTGCKAFYMDATTCVGGKREMSNSYKAGVPVASLFTTFIHHFLTVIHSNT